MYGVRIKCCKCDNNVHVFCATAVSDSDEGYGQPVICFKCKPSEGKSFCDIYMSVRTGDFFNFRIW